MKILVLGGSYFLGKHFVRLASIEHEVIVFNRGTRPLNMPDVTEIYGDRHDKEALKRLATMNFHIVVDFCAYNKGDIRGIYEVFRDSLVQYIFVSTVDVYMHGTGAVMDEYSAMETRTVPGEVGAYIAGKIALEQEIIECYEDYGVYYTIVRPAMIYGPDNYAPREGMYFHWLRTVGQILSPADATGEFQLIYVKDAARAIVNMLGNAKAFSERINLVNEERITYEKFEAALSEATGVRMTKVTLPVSEINARGIPLPFPLTLAESNFYSGERGAGFIGRYTSLTDGLREAYEAFIEEND